MKKHFSMHLEPYILLIALLASSAGVKINKLHVPDVISHGKSVVLDCDFTLEEDDQDLVVKWFFNKTLVYQWIPGTKKKPQGLGALKDRLDLDYSASLEANSRHRALNIINPGPDLSGDYTCSVSTLQSEDIRTKRMVVLVSERNLILRRLQEDNTVMRVQCLADGVFPKPLVSLHSQKREITAEITSLQRGQLYEVLATAVLPPLKDPEEFSCKLHIPEANYTKKRETVFYPGYNSSWTCVTSRWLIMLLVAIARMHHLFIGRC